MKCKVVEYRHIRDWDTPKVVFEGSKAECWALANSMADEFRCGAVRFEDGREIEAFPVSTLPGQRDAAYAFELRESNWRELLR